MDHHPAHPAILFAVLDCVLYPINAYLAYRWFKMRRPTQARITTNATGSAQPNPAVG